MATIKKTTKKKAALSSAKSSRASAATSSNTRMKGKEKVSKAKPQPKPKDTLEQSKLQEYFLEGIKDLYGAEKQLLKALPKLHKAATTEELKDAIAAHMDETEGQVSRIEEIFELLEEPAKSKKCEAMAGLVKEGEEAVKETDK